MGQPGQDRGITHFGDTSDTLQTGFLKLPGLTSSCSQWGQNWTHTKHFPAQVLGVRLKTGEAK